MLKEIKYKLIRFLIIVLGRRKRCSYQIRVVEGDEELEELFRFRYRIYCQTDNLLDAAEYPTESESDKYDKVAVHIAAYGDDEEIAGMVRVIPHSDLGLPTIEEFELEDEVESDVLNQAVEVSRFMVDPQYRGSLLMLDLCRAAYCYTKEEGVRYYIGCGEDWFMQMIEKLFLKVNLLAEPRWCFNAQNFPFIINLDEATKELRRKKPLLFTYFNYCPGELTE